MAGTAADERRRALHALLMRPLLPASDPAYPLVRRHGEELRVWLMREAGWTFAIEREGARLFKRPADTTDATRGAEGDSRQRSLLFCLACAALERAEVQITLLDLGTRLLELAADPALLAAGFSFALDQAHERRDLVFVCRRLLALGVLHRVAGDEDGYAQGASGDALYDVQRRLLALLFVGLRGPSTFAASEAPATLEARLAALTVEAAIDSPEARRNRLRHRLTRRLLDDPVVYFDELEADERDYLVNQRGPMAARLAEFTGLIPEQRAEGLALIDEDGSLTDAMMPAEGTEAHVTLLVAEHLANLARQSGVEPVTELALQRHIHLMAESFGRYWRKDAREPGAERALVAQALNQLEALKLVRREAGVVIARPALPRYALGEPRLTQASLLSA